jgi:hypothetical protein
MNVFETYHYRWQNIVFRVLSGQQKTECRVGGAKLSKTKQTAISKNTSEDDATFFFFRPRTCNTSRVCPWKQKVNSKIYVGALGRLLKRIRRVRTAKFQSSECFLLHDNTLSHNVAFVNKLVANRNVAVPHYPPYSPDLASADYLVFPKFKYFLKWRHFQTVEGIQCAVTRELNNI